MYISGNQPQGVRKLATVEVVGSGTSRQLQMDVYWRAFSATSTGVATHRFRALRISSFHSTSLLMVTYVVCYPNRGGMTYLVISDDGSTSTGLNYVTSSAYSESYPSSGVVRYSIATSDMPALPAEIFDGDTNHIIEVLI